MSTSESQSGTPTPQKVERLATESVQFDRIALLGIFGAEKDLHALIRLPQGATQKVGIGDRISGGTVIAIGKDQLVLARPDGQHIMHMPRS